jgi:hypothetical protein
MQKSAASSGIKGTTRSVVMSGVRGGATVGGLASVEFAIAPVQSDKPLYDKATFVKSNEQGAFEVELPPGTYWVGSKAKALDPVRYVADSVVFSETIVEVKSGTFTAVELVETGYAP